MPRSAIKLIVVLFVVLAAAATIAASRSKPAPPLVAADHPDAPTVAYQGKTYRVVGGAVYEPQGGMLHYVERIYATDFHDRNYVREATQVYRIVDGRRYPVLLRIDEGFESAERIADLVGPDRPWHSITLQSPRAPTVERYVELRQRVLRGRGEFLDNRIEPSTAQAHSGKKALRALAVPPGNGASFSKASLESELVYFVKGDEVRLSAWFYIARGRPVGLLDVESSYVLEYPGMRILLDEALSPRVELKWADKPTYRASGDVRLPVGRWVELRLHMILSDRNDGRVELWVDGTSVIRARGQTLPLADTVYDRIEIGITANTGETAEVFVDDVRMAKGPFP